MNNKAYVICRNDAIEFVVIGNEEKAKRELNVLRNHHYSLRRKQFNNDPDNYDNIFYWHIHTVNYKIED
jgi:hypothetical protein